MIYTPYTYYLYWSDQDTHYYGVRWSKHITGYLPEEDLWVRYFTSSKYVREFREEYGDPDIIRVCQTFDAPEKALAWETKFLKRVDAANSDQWLNRCNADGLFFDGIHPPELVESIAAQLRGVPRPEEVRKKISEGHKGKKLSDKTKAKLRTLNWKGGHTSGKENRQWFNDGKTNKKFKPSAVPDGWVRGRIYPLT